MPYPDAKYPYDQRLARAAPDLMAALLIATDFINGHNECLSLPLGNGDRAWNDYCIGLAEDCKSAIAKAKGKESE